jgi:hypothetical protein
MDSGGLTCANQRSFVPNTDIEWVPRPRTYPDVLVYCYFLLAIPMHAQNIPTRACSLWVVALRMLGRC